MSESPTPAGGLTMMQAVAVGVNTTSPAFSLAAILAPMALLVGYATPIVLFISFIPMALTSLAFMYLNRRDPDCGTTFSWVSRALGPRPGFIAGWTIAAAGVLVLGSLAETAIAYGFLTFGLDALANNAFLVRICATVLIILMTGLSILGTESSVRLQTVLTFLQVGILLIFAAASAVLALRNQMPSFNSDWINPLSQGMPHLIAAMLLGVFAFWGWEAATNLSEECRKPSDAGRAGVISTIILLTTYVAVALFVVMYLGESGFYPVGESGLVLVDMSGVVLGPFAFLVLLAVALSALASTQSTMVPGSRAVLSMARRGALPAHLGLTHPRFKSPWASLALLGGIAATWYFFISSISANAMIDTLSSLGILVAFYYSITGIACVVFYRKHVVSSLKGFLMVGVGPTLGSIGLLFMLIVGIQSVADPKESATGTPWLGLAPPLTIAAVVMLIGLIVMFIRAKRSPSFFKSSREVADLAKSPFPVGRDVPIASGGILVDCNESIEHLMDLLEAHRESFVQLNPITLTFGIHPSGLSGAEFDDARAALIVDADRIFGALERALKPLSGKRIHRLFEESDAMRSVEAGVALAQPAVVLTRHPHSV